MYGRAMLIQLASAALFVFEPSAPELGDPEAGIFAEVYAQIRPMLLATLITVAIVVLGLIGNLARALGPKFVEWLPQHIKDAGVRAALELIERAASAGVDAMEQTMVQRLKAMDPVGILDPQQRRQVFEGALDAAQAHVGPKMWQEAARKLDITPERIVELLGTQIEATIQRRKLARSPAPIDEGGNRSEPLA